MNLWNETKKFQRKSYAGEKQSEMLIFILYKALLNTESFEAEILSKSLPVRFGFLNKKQRDREVRIRAGASLLMPDT